MENHIRSILKSVSFRLVATFATVVSILLITQDVVASFQIGVIDFFGKIALYYYHERLWNMVTLGRE